MYTTHHLARLSPDGDYMIERVYYCDGTEDRVIVARRATLEEAQQEADRLNQEHDKACKQGRR